MKKLLLLPLVFAAVLFTSCSDDDNGDCAQADFVGTYVGTMTDALGTTSDSTFEVTAGSNDTDITVGGNAVNIDGCEISGGTSILGTGVEYTGNLDGTTITLNQITKLTGIDDVTVTWTGEKQ